MIRERRKLTAIVAFDVAGYSRLMERDESGTLAAMIEHRTARLEPALARHGGRLIKLTGDGALAEFASVVDALNAAIEFQREMARANLSRRDDERISYRIGIHIGDVIIEGDDLYGDGVNVAARLEGRAPSGGILISGNARDAVLNRVSAEFRDLGKLTLKNIERPVQAFQVMFDQEERQGAGAQATTPGSTMKSSGAASDVPLIAVRLFLAVKYAAVALTGIAISVSVFVWFQPWKVAQEDVIESRAHAISKRSFKRTSRSQDTRPIALLTEDDVRTLKPKDEFQECNDCPRMVVLPSGEFLMGSPASEVEALTKKYGAKYEQILKQETPQHKVAVKVPFAVGQTHITRWQFATFVNETGLATGRGCYKWAGTDFKRDDAASWEAPGFDQADDHPAVCLNYNDALAFIKWLNLKVNSKSDDSPYRLLTEAEAEYATRAATTATPQPRYFFGDDEKDLCIYANASDETTKGQFPTWTAAPCKDGFVFTAPVISFEPNAFGLHDMHGNAWTWTQDCWINSYAEELPNATSACNMRTLRGGSWYNYPWKLRSSYRIGLPPGSRYYDTGLRVARLLLAQ